MMCHELPAGGALSWDGCGARLWRGEFGLAKERYQWYGTRMVSELMQYSGGALECNGYLVVGAHGECVAVDAPDGFAEWALAQLSGARRITHLLLTHQHFDHIQDAASLQRATGCLVHAGAAYDPSLTLAQNALAWGLPEPESFVVDAVVPAQDVTLTLAGMPWRALHVPGHAPDSLAWYATECGEVFTGDALFAGSVGRTDFPGGNAQTLQESIRRKILTLDPHTAVHPGHGPGTSVGEELLNNPFVHL